MNQYNMLSNHQSLEDVGPGVLTDLALTLEPLVPAYLDSNRAAEFAVGLHNFAFFYGYSFEAAMELFSQYMRERDEVQRFTAAVEQVADLFRRVS